MMAEGGLQVGEPYRTSNLHFSYAADMVAYRRWRNRLVGLRRIRAVGGRSAS